MQTLFYRLLNISAK